MRIVFMVTLVLAFACKAKQPLASAAEQTEALLHLNGQWILSKLNGQNIDKLSYLSKPHLEFQTAEKRLSGNDGCNSFFGQLEQLDQQRLEIGLLGSTKAICPDVKDSDLLGKYLYKVKTYKIDNNKLYLYDDAGKEVLLYERTDWNDL